MKPGDTFGSYHVVAPLGAGGMGEVYRARDTKLKRDVAIKVLPDAFAHDPERVARFEREARGPRLAQSSAHRRDLRPRGAAASRVPRPGAGRGRDAGGAHRGAARCRCDEALAIARQIADALEAAHEQGHHPSRSEAGQHQDHARRQVKVLDFGLAKVHAGAAAAAGIRTRRR